MLFSKRFPNFLGDSLSDRARPRSVGCTTRKPWARLLGSSVPLHVLVRQRWTGRGGGRSSGQLLSSQAMNLIFNVLPGLGDKQCLCADQ